MAGLGESFVRHPWRRTASPVTLTTLTVRTNGHVYQSLSKDNRSATYAVPNPVLV
jgi:hypothetical protein